MVDFTIVEKIFVYNPLEITGYAAGAALLLTLLIIADKPKKVFAKVLFFLLLALIILGTTAYITGDTLYKIKNSPTKGPVHWHADFRIFRCGEELDLIDPQGLSNRIGVPTVHEHGDKRIHVEGLIADLEEASLAGFFEATGGMLTKEKLVFPTNTGEETLHNGDQCNGAEGLLQVFLWETAERLSGGPIAVQRKLVDFPSYVMKSEELIPPGDCIIFEFDPEKEKTRYICEQYEVAASRGDIVIER